MKRSKVIIAVIAIIALVAAARFSAVFFHILPFCFTYTADIFHEIRKTSHKTGIP